jgi:hypothetical protein
MRGELTITLNEVELRQALRSLEKEDLFQLWKDLDQDYQDWDVTFEIASFFLEEVKKALKEGAIDEEMLPESLHFLRSTEEVKLTEEEVKVLGKVYSRLKK